MSDHDPYGGPQQPHQPQPGPGVPPPIPQYPGQSPQPPGQSPVPRQPGPGSFGAGVPPAQATTPPKRRRIWLWLIAIPVALGLLIGGCSLALFLATSPAVDATNEYVALLDEENYGAAYDSLCAAARRSTDRDTYIASTRDRIGGEITDYRFSNVSITNSVADVSGTISIDGVAVSVRYELVQEDGDWRVCGGSL